MWAGWMVIHLSKRLFAALRACLRTYRLATRRTISTWPIVCFGSRCCRWSLRRFPRDEVAVPEPFLCGSPVMIAIDASPPTNPPCTPTTTTTWRSTPRFLTHESTMHAHHDHHLAVNTALLHPQIHHARHAPRPPHHTTRPATVKATRNQLRR